MVHITQSVVLYGRCVWWFPGGMNALEKRAACRDSGIHSGPIESPIARRRSNSHTEEFCCKHTRLVLHAAVLNAVFESRRSPSIATRFEMRRSVCLPTSYG